MPSFDKETIVLWRRERIAEHCKKSALRALVQKEWTRRARELAESEDAELLGQELINMGLSEREIVERCANKKGVKWLEGQRQLELYHKTKGAK